MDDRGEDASTGPQVVPLFGTRFAAQPDRKPVSACMSVQPFTSESYAAAERDVAWRDLLGAFGLRSAGLMYPHQGPITALSRTVSDGLGLIRFAAAPQTLSPRIQRHELPVLLIPSDDGAILTKGTQHQAVRAGDLLVLPRHEGWQLTIKRDWRATALAVTTEAFSGRRGRLPDVREAQLRCADGLAAVLRSTILSVSDELESLTGDAWIAVRASLSDLFLSWLRELVPENADGGSAALIDRIYDSLERRLSDPDLTLARVAQSEGISERYLQKLLEARGDNFSHYLRERRLQRCWADLSDPAQASHSVSEIAFRTGFNDAAHFSRTFRDRFGLSPRAFRQREAAREAEEVAPGQRGWPKDASVQMRSTGPAEVIGSISPASAHNALRREGQAVHHELRVCAETVHWGYFSRRLKPLLEVTSGDRITVETLSQHASDDPERMIAGDRGAENVFRWTADAKAVDRRGAGPMNASIYGRGAGEGFGVHICTGPIAVKDAQPGDVLEVRILDIVPRVSRNPDFAGRVFGSSVAAWWGYHYSELVTGKKTREAVTIYEIMRDDETPYARALYSYLWEPQIDPSGVIHKTYDYPGVPVMPGSVQRQHDILEGIRIPLRPHFGVIGVAPREDELIDSVPPAYFGGNLDNWRLGKGATVYLPVSVAGALLSVGDPHAAQGDGELGGTAIECSMTGTFEAVLHKKADLGGKPFDELTSPLIETKSEWVLTGFSHPNYLAEFGAKGQSEVYAKSSLDLAMRDAFRKVRRFLMTTQGLTEDEAIALMSAAVDFGVTQVVDGNWGVHAIIKKDVFAEREGRA